MVKEFNVMVDLETLGTSPGAPILSIGAVLFTPEGGPIFSSPPEEEGFEGLGDTFYRSIKLGSCFKAGLKADADTIEWWSIQTPAAQEVFTDPARIPLLAALEQFNHYLASLDGCVLVWGNGAAFDNAVLTAAYKAVELEPAWPCWNDRCYRTLKALCPDVKLVRIGTHHHALDDAISQARHAMDIFAELRD